MTKKQENQPVVGIPADTNNLHLTEEQEHAIKLWGSTAYEKDVAAAVGVTPEILQDWRKQTLFRLALLNEGYEYEADMDELQAVVLILDNVTFADAEKTLELDPGTITEWAKDADSPFARLKAYMRAEARKEDDSERYAKQEAEKKALKDQQMLAIPLILAGKTDAEVAEAVGVARETINRWRNHDFDFQRELSESRAAYLGSHMMALTRVNKKAVDVLENLLDSDDEQIRMRAAMHLLKTVPLTHKKQ
jgi:DNA-binding XRE family transcriptional regulator